MRRALPAVRDQLRAGDQLIVVDNDSSDGTADAVREVAPGATLIEAGSNLGFAAGSNRGAALASTELLVFLNPDATPADGFLEAIEGPLSDGRGWDAWQGLVTAEGGRVVNTRGGLVHFSGIAWAGGAGESLAAEPMAARAGLRLRGLPGDPPGAVRAGGRLRRGVLPLPRGRRPVASAAARGRDPGSGARRPRRPRLRVREGSGQVAPAGAKPLGDSDPNLPGRPAGGARSGARSHRAGHGADLDRRGLVRRRRRRRGPTWRAPRRGCGASGARFRRPGRFRPASSPAL